MDLLTRTCFKNLYTKVVFLKISKFYKLSDIFFFYYMFINKLIAENKQNLLAFNFFSMDLHKYMYQHMKKE